ncbi:hypothetical protein GGI03_000463 [Coemansia sp. RSA 2337]|nr:hypothetical protein GGI03_000463 [Coemansia sp. RSA 2337]
MVESVEPSNFIGTYDKTFRGADINVLATEAHDHVRQTTIGYNENIQIDFVGLSIEVEHSFEVRLSQLLPHLDLWTVKLTIDGIIPAQPIDRDLTNADFRPANTGIDTDNSDTGSE